MKNTLKSWTDEIAKIINPTFVRPYLKFASKVWNSNLEYDSKRSESAQRRSNLTKQSIMIQEEARKTMFDGPENSTREMRFHPYLQNCARSKES